MRTEIETTLLERALEYVQRFAELNNEPAAGDCRETAAALQRLIDAAPEPPATYGEGANLYIVRPHVDAWAIHDIRVRADTPDEALQLVKDDRSMPQSEIDWGPADYSHMDHVDYEVHATDEHGEAADILIEF